jgi:hypothetical protein
MATVPLSTTGKPATERASTSAKQGQRSFLPVFDWTIARVMAVLGTIMVPVGIVVILLGWWGAAHTPFVFEQIPYLISGGLLGVGLLTGGGLLYLGSWYSRLAEQQREEGEKLRDAIKAVRQEIEYLPATLGGAGAASVEQSFVATKTGTMFHVPDCSVVAGRGDLRQVSASDGLTPCKICQPTAEA